MGVQTAHSIKLISGVPNSEEAVSASRISPAWYRGHSCGKRFPMSVLLAALVGNYSGRIKK